MAGKQAKIRTWAELGIACDVPQATAYSWSKHPKWPFDRGTPPQDVKAVLAWRDNVLRPKHSREGREASHKRKSADAVSTASLEREKLQQQIRALKLKNGLTESKFKRRLEVELVKRASALRSDLSSIPRSVAPQVRGVLDLAAIELVIEQAIEGAMARYSQA